MGLKNKKGFVHTLEAVIAASLLITTATVVIPQIQPDTRLKDNTQENIFQGMQTFDKTGKLKDELSPDALKKDIRALNPDEFNLTVLVSDTTTESFRLEVDEIPWDYTERAEVKSKEEWNGDFNQTSVDRDDKSGNLGIGYHNGTSKDNLVAYWRNDGDIAGDGGTVRDYSGNEYSGTTQNGVSTGEQGIFSTNSFKFNPSTNEYVKTTYTGNITGEITVSLWARIQDRSNDFKLISKPYDGTNTSWEFKIVGQDDVVGDSSNDITFGSYDGSEHRAVIDSDKISDDKWYHFTGVYNGTQWKIYVNGSDSTDALEGDQSVGAVKSTGPVIYPGQYDPSSDSASQFVNSTIDEIRIYNRSLSESEIKKLYFDGKNGKFEGNYSQGFQIPYEEVPEKIEINSTDVDSSENISWVKADTSQGESNEFKLDSGTVNRNYSLGFSQEASNANIEFNFSVENSNPTKTPVIRDFKLWTNDSSDKTIEFDKTGDSVKSQIFVDDSDSLNISYNSNLIAENITDSKYVFHQTENDGILKFYGDANLTVDITNKTIKGEAADQDDVKNVNYPVYQNGSNEVTVSTWN